MTTKSKILRALRQAPSTSSELGAILFPKMAMRSGMRLCSAHLCYLRTEGVIEVIGKVDRYRAPTPKVMANLYRISARTSLAAKTKTKQKYHGKNTLE